MGVNFIITLLIGLVAVLAIIAWFFDQWRSDEDDDFEPYG